MTGRVMLVVVLVAHVEHASATYLRRVQCGLHLKRRVCGTIVAQPSVELAPLLGVHRCGILRAFVVAVFDWVKTEESRHPLVDRAAERTDKDPAVAAFERVIGLKTRRPVAGMPVDRTLTGEDRQRIAVGLRDRFILCEVDYLAPSALLTLPQRHHRRSPAGERGHIVAGIRLRTLRRTRWVTCQ